METFGDYVKSMRIEKEMTLRSFCSEAGVDPSNWSKIERNLLEPPKTPEMLDKIGAALGFGDQENQKLKDLATIAVIPDNLQPKEVIELLPVFFRTSRGDTPTKEELERLTKLINPKT